MDNIVNLLDLIDWSQFIPSLLATSVGCTLAIYFTSRYDKRNLRKEQKEIEKNIFLELKKIHQQLTKIRDDQKDAEFFYIAPIKTPFYDSLVHARKLNLLASSNWLYDSQNPSDESVLLLYEYISEFNTWHTWRTNNKGNAENLLFVQEHLGILEDKILSLIEKMSVRFEEGVP